MAFAQKVDYSVVYVPEETGIDFTQITNNGDYVCMPLVKRTRTSLNWFTNRILDISIDGSSLAYLSFRNDASNIFIKDLNKQGGSMQRTNRKSVLDFSYSPDGKNISFSEQRGNSIQIFQTDANSGYVCRQITQGAMDYTPVYSSDMKQLFFARQEKSGISIWSYTFQSNFLSSFSAGMNPYPVNGQQSYFCTRANNTGRNEIWKVDYGTGIEECIVSDPERGFSTPSISPDGKWLLFVGESVINTGSFIYRNTDIFVCHLDGSQMSQITYHAADDLSPVWSRDGKFIYFVSQRGNAEGSANVWRMSFNY